MKQATQQLTTMDSIVHLYQTYATDLGRVRDSQRELARTRPLRPKLDDVEAEMTYLLIRAVRPQRIVEIGTFHGWSTTWILQALRDNGSGTLHSYDLVDHATRSVPADLSRDRWSFHHGDVRRVELDPPDYLFLDAAHSARFARWYTAHLLPRLRAGTVVSIHDVYHHRFAVPLTEGPVALRWLRATSTPFFTASRTHAPIDYFRLTDLKRKLGLDEPVHQVGTNPMILFQPVSTHFDPAVTGGRACVRGSAGRR